MYLPVRIQMAHCHCCTTYELCNVKQIGKLNNIFCLFKQITTVNAHFSHKYELYVVNFLLNEKIHVNDRKSSKKITKSTPLREDFLDYSPRPFWRVRWDIVDLKGQKTPGWKGLTERNEKRTVIGLF